MSFAIKKSNEVTYISQNSTTTNPNSDNWSENGNKIYNNNTGNVGINNSDPSFNLDVSGTTNITGNLTVDTNVLLVDVSNNRVGINNSNPSFDLDISSNLNITGQIYTSGVAGNSYQMLSRNNTGSMNWVNPPVSLGLRLTSVFIPLSDISTAITFDNVDTFLSPGFVQIVTRQKYRVNYAGTYLLNVGLEVKAPDNENYLDFFIRRGAIRTIKYTLQPGVINHISINTCETMSTNEEIYFAAGLTTAPTGTPQLRYTTLTFSKINNEY
jgi:hypothetical protein